MVDKRSVILVGIAFVYVAIPACANGNLGQALQRSLSADPRLSEDSAVFGNASDASSLTQCSNEVLSQLPELFPIELCYPNADLRDVSLSGSEEANRANMSNTASETDNTNVGTSETDTRSGIEVISTQWQTVDSAQRIQQYYRSYLETESWEIAFQADEDTTRELEAVKQGDRIIVLLQDNTLSTQPSDNQTRSQPQSEARTQFTVEFYPMQVSSGDSTVLTPETSRLFSQINPNDEEPPSVSVSENAPRTLAPPQHREASSLNFSDISQAPEELQTYIEDLARLGIFSTSRNDEELHNELENPSLQSSTTFRPNDPITRQDYAQWLLIANNVFYGDRPSRKIRPAATSTTPVFQDVAESGPGYEAIQGLAEAGLIPSSLSGDSTIVNFRPDASLTREVLIAWKVPLDRRGSLPTATVEAIEETWGFQDATRIAPNALQSILADYQNGDNSNILRAFGYTTLFQPQKAVTRAEAAAVLWYFGYQADGISANSLIPERAS